MPLALFFIFRELWLFYIRTLYLGSVKWKMLEVKVPREILKTPKAMEQIFAAVHGIYPYGFRFWEKYWEGKVDPWMSFELVGYAGGVYFYIYTPSQYRNLIESAIYAQYPDAEIMESSDYTELMPSILPNQTYDFWGTDFILTKDDAYPIRTYPYFEESQEEKRLDPVAAITEVMSNLKEGESIWLQILVRPTDDGWKKKAEELVGKLIGKKTAKKTGFMDWLGTFLRNLLTAPFEPPTWPTGGGKSDDGPANLMMFLTPGEKDVVKAVEEKISKLGFECNLRFIYIDRRDSFTRANVSAIIGALRQFNTLNLNGFRINKYTMTRANQPFKELKLRLRKHRLYELYRWRAFPAKFFILNIEELATVYHFPTMFVESPLIRRLESKKGEPPASLPIG